MKKATLLFALVLSITFQLFAYNNLRVGDPRNSWYTYQGTIEEATFTVKPKGIYMEVGMYLTFSARGTNFTSDDSLEVVLNFDLPEDAIVNDSWLWIGDDIVRGDIMDRWSASSIYEGFVQRRTDPSILTKESSTQYSLRIFPMEGDDTRKVKLTFLLPTDWSSDEVFTTLPTQILSTSYNTLASCDVITFPSSSWQNPRISGNSTFYQGNSSEFGTYYYSSIPSSNYNSATRIFFDSPMNNGVYVSKYEGEDESYYQMAILPQEVIGTSAAKKVAVLVDYDENNTNLSKSDLLNSLKEVLHNELNEQDAFNIITSNLMIHRVSGDWIPADSLAIENAFIDLENHLSNYSNLSSLVVNGIDFVQSSGDSDQASILLLSNTDEYGDDDVANDIINDIMDLMNPDIPMYFADYQTGYLPYYNINGRYYRGNEYFYSNLSVMTSGAFYRLYATGHTFTDIIEENMNEISGIMNAFDLYTDVANGFCFGRYNVGVDENINYINEPILQVGQYNGDFPLSITMSGEYNGSFYGEEIIIEEANAVQADSSCKAIWSGLLIRDLEKEVQTNNVIDNIIIKSIESRVLSKYTAFLCLEDTAQICHSCVDESVLTSIEDSLETTAVEILAYPNPFTETVKISIADPNQTFSTSSTFKIYNMQGVLIKTFDYSEAVMVSDKLIFTWMPDTDLPAGIYYFLITNGTQTESIKLLKN